MDNPKKVRLQSIDTVSGEILETFDVVTSADAVTVTKAGNEINLQSYLDNLVLQKGDKGDTGAVGSTGPKGEPGDNVRVGTSYAGGTDVKLFFKVVE